MSFDVAADAYDRFMGRYSSGLAPAFADFARVDHGKSVLDVGCGPGALTAELVARVGSRAVSAVDPSESFVAAARERHPEVDVYRSSAEELPFAADAFDVTLAQLVVHFMRDPVAGLGEMRRVTRSDGVVAASVWDSAGQRAPISTFWRAARELQSDVRDEATGSGATQGQLSELFEAAGIRRVEETALACSVDYASFDEWWEPYTLGVGPAGSYAASLDPGRLASLRERCRALLPPAPFTVTAFAWAARGFSPGAKG